MNKHIYIKNNSPITRNEAIRIARSVSKWVVLPVDDNKIMLDSGDYSSAVYEITKAGAYWGQA